MAQKKQRLEQAGRFFGRCTAVLCLLLALTGLALGVWSGRGVEAAAGVLLCLPVGWLLRKLSKEIRRLGEGKALLLLTVLCLIWKLVWVLWATVPPESDYKTFWDYAQQLAARDVIWGGRYLALFPHIFGYAWFLSGLIRMFGALPLLAPVTNALLSVCAGILLFSIAKKRFGFETGAAAFLLWTVCPSQTIYNMFVLSEPLYTTLLLGVLAVLTAFEDKAEQCGRVRPAVSGLGAGLLLAGVNLTRPVGAIVLIGLVLWLGLVRIDGWKHPIFRRSWAVFLAVLVVSYGVLGMLGRQELARRIGEEPASTTGFNILVGFHQESGGKWNWEDSNTLDAVNTPDRSAQEVQQEMLERAMERITSGEIDFPILLRDKLTTFLGSDDACVGYASSVIRHEEQVKQLCNGFWYGILFLAAAGCVLGIRAGERRSVQMGYLYFIGLTMAQMLVEVAGRYHYSLLPLLILTAAGAVMGTERGAHGVRSLQG